MTARTTPSRRGLFWCVVTLVILVAAVLRFSELGAVPPGLAHDEVANWLIARRILSGDHAIYFTEAYGHEPLYQYIQAATVALLGDHWLGLRYPSAALGLLGLAVTIALARRLFGRQVSLLTGAWMALSFWPVFYARVALRAILLPLVAGLSLLFIVRALDRPGTEARRMLRSDWVLGGLFLGVSAYTYMASRILPLIYVVFWAYLLLVHQPARRQWREMLVAIGVAMLVASPLILWLAAHPGAEYRIAEVREPLDRLLSGDPGPALRNLAANLAFFTVKGDPLPRQNMPGRPVFVDPVSVLLFTVGVLIAAWRAVSRRPDYRYGVLLIWLLGALGPSVVTTMPPSSIRDILGLNVTFIFPALAAVEIGRAVRGRALARPRLARALPLVLGCLALLPAGILTVRDYFFRWPRHSVVRFDYQVGLTDIGRHLDALPTSAGSTVGGLSIHTMDGPSLALATRSDANDVRLCDTRQTLVLAAADDAWLFVPDVVPLDSALRDQLLVWGGYTETVASSFIAYRLPGGLQAPLDVLAESPGRVALPDGSDAGLPASFENHLAFLGYRWLATDAGPGQSLELLTYWRVRETPQTRLKVFVHLTTAQSDVPFAQHDGLAMSNARWFAGDLVIQKHVIPWPDDTPSGSYRVQLGVYDVATWRRLDVLTSDRLLLD